MTFADALGSTLRLLHPLALSWTDPREGSVRVLHHQERPKSGRVNTLVLRLVYLALVVSMSCNT